MLSTLHHKGRRGIWQRESPMVAVNFKPVDSQLDLFTMIKCYFLETPWFILIQDFRRFPCQEIACR